MSVFFRDNVELGLGLGEEILLTLALFYVELLLCFDAEYF